MTFSKKSITFIFLQKKKKNNITFNKINNEKKYINIKNK